MSRLSYVGATPTHPTDVGNRLQARTILTSGSVNRTAVTTQINDAIALRASKTYIDTQDAQFQLPSYYQTRDALNIPISSVGQPNGVAYLDAGTGKVSLGGSEIKYNARNYVDIGFGYKLGPDGKVDPNTAFQDTFSGVECFGYGKDPATGVPLNAYSLLSDMVTSLKANDLGRLGEDLDAITDSMTFMLRSITEVGARGVTLQNTQGNLENEYVVLVDTQNKLEGLDISEEIIYNKEYELSWNVTLQLGSKTLPTSIFDFLR